MGHEHTVHDSDARFIIDPITRGIKNSSNKKITLIQFDHNSERFTFEIPKEIEGHDMSLCNKVEVHYFNIDGNTKKKNSGVYTVEDLHVDENNPEAVVCSWLISIGATKLNGLLKFLLRYKCVDEAGIETYAWNTAFFTGISVSEGSDADASFETEYVDIIEQWKSSVLQGFEDEFTAWKEQIETQVGVDISKWKQEAYKEVDQYIDTHSKEWTNGLASANEKLGFLSNYVTPEMFGAKGDGVTDDTEALKRCLVSGNFIFLKRTYRITETLRFSNLKNVVMYGGKIVRDADKTFATIKGGSCSNIHIVNIEFDGNGNNSETEYSWSDEAQICIFLAGDCHDIFVEKCLIKNHNYGIFTLGAEFTEGIISANATIRDCRFDNCCSCIDTYGKNILIDHNVFYNITGDAIQIEPEGSQSNGNPLNDANFYQCAMGCIISNNMLANIKGTAIIIHDNAYGVKIDNNTIVDFGFAINANREFKGCYVSNNTIIHQKDVAVNTDKRPWDLTYFAIYCGKNSVVENNYLEKCFTAIQGREGSVIQGNTIVSPVVSAIVVSSSDETLIHFIKNNIVKEFTKNDSAWWGANPIVLNGGKAVLVDNIVYSDCEPVCNNGCKAQVNGLISTTKQTTSITAIDANIYSN